MIPRDLLVDFDVSNIPVSLYSSNETPQLKFGTKAEALENSHQSEECSGKHLLRVSV